MSSFNDLCCGSRNKACVISYQLVSAQSREFFPCDVCIGNGGAAFTNRVCGGQHAFFHSQCSLGELQSVIITARLFLICFHIS